MMNKLLHSQKIAQTSTASVRMQLGPEQLKVSHYFVVATE